MTEPMCATCETYDEAAEIHGPEALRRIIRKLESAIEQRHLRPVEDASDDTDLPAFADLDVSETLPDVIAYRFECTTCGRAFALTCECYHGAGGCWQRC